MEPIKDPETHKQRHIELHHAIDELLADFIINANGRPSMKIFALLEWSNKQTEKPDHDFNV
jgi:hypothetical protein